MTKVFISYGSEGYEQSLRAIAREARHLGIFDKVITYGPKDMPSYINSSPLKAYKRGNGYWVWKPYIIWHTMMEYPKSIIVYADAGCTLHENLMEWNTWFSMMDEYDTLAFQYRNDYQYPWEPIYHCKTTNLEWTKEALVRYFDPLFGNRDWLLEGQVMSGIIVACRMSKAIKMWLDITMMRPDLVFDVFGNETVEQHSAFKEHRQDQSVWSATAFYYAHKGNVLKILPETAESVSDAAVSATRRRNLEIRIPIKTRLIGQIKKRIGSQRYDWIHGKLSSSSLFRKIILLLEHNK